MITFAGYSRFVVFTSFERFGVRDTRDHGRPVEVPECGDAVDCAEIEQAAQADLHATASHQFRHPAEQLLDVMPGGRNKLVEHPRVGRCLVGDHLRRCHPQCGQRGAKGAAGRAADAAFGDEHVDDPAVLVSGPANNSSTSRLARGRSVRCGRRWLCQSTYSRVANSTWSRVRHGLVR